MEINIKDKMEDNRSECLSILCSVKTGQYIEFITEPYAEKGGIEGQREPLKTNSAARIRERMINDIIHGTVLPPIVIGVIVTNEIYIELTSDVQNERITEIITQVDNESIMIIDGMQRTTAIMKSLESEDIKERPLRVEFWVSRSINSLIYRMLILNTGQVPWNLRRQLEVVFKGMIKEIKSKVDNISVITIDDKSRRKGPSEFQANDLIELYLVFGGRKEKIDTKQKLADEFTRLDFIEATENKDFTPNFYNALQYLGKLDVVFAKFNCEEKGEKFSTGSDLFKSQPARAGFMAAIAKQVYGRPGIKKSSDVINELWTNLASNITSFVTKLSRYEENQIEEFLQLPLLNENLSMKSNKVGDFEREFFTKSFETLIELDFKVDSLEVCWRAY